MARILMFIPTRLSRGMEYPRHILANADDCTLHGRPHFERRAVWILLVPEFPQAIHVSLPAWRSRG